MVRQDPLRNFRFRVEIDGIQQAGFSEAVIGECTTEAIDYREGSEPNIVRKLPGLTRFGNITLKSGVTTSLELFNWHKQFADGKAARKNVVIIVSDEAGNDRARFVAQWAWPVKYQVGNLNGMANEVFVELLELTNEGIERVV